MAKHVSKDILASALAAILAEQSTAGNLQEQVNNLQEQINNIRIIDRRLVSQGFTQNGETKTWTIEFNPPFPSTPAIVATPCSGPPPIYVYIDEISTSGCKVIAKNASGQQSWITVHLIAAHHS